MSQEDHDIARLLSCADSYLHSAKLPEERAGAMMIAACALMVKAGFSRADSIHAARYVIDKFFNTLEEIEREEMP